MEDYASRNINSANRGSYDQAVIDFRNWQDNPNKHVVTQYYSDFHFGLCYVDKLFRSRVQSFYQVLLDISCIEEVKRRMLEDLSITSFGCGPGPEIVAYVSFMRSQLDVKKRLDFTAVDKIAYWKYFLDVTPECDRNITITFQNSILSENYLQRIDNQGICIMSYPEAVNFGNIWESMKKKFHLIIILDQSKSQLHESLRLAGFTIKFFQFKGSKSYSYYLSDINIIIPESDSATVSEEEEGGFWSILSKCIIL